MLFNCYWLFYFQIANSSVLIYLITLIKAKLIKLHYDTPLSNVFTKKSLIHQLKSKYIVITKKKVDNILSKWKNMKTFLEIKFKAFVHILTYYLHKPLLIFLEINSWFHNLLKKNLKFVSRNSETFKQSKKTDIFPILVKSKIKATKTNCFSKRNSKINSLLKEDFQKFKLTKTDIQKF